MAMLLLHGQVLIDPAGDGGMESGSGFAANNWLTAPDGNNNWSADAATVYAGAASAYVSDDNGITNAFNNAAASISHFYRDVVVPAGATAITLSFFHKGDFEPGGDGLLVFTASTAIIPVGGSLPPGANLVYQQVANVNVYTQSVVVLPDALAGTTLRLIFTWQNDANSSGVSPAALDDISLTYTPCLAVGATGSMTGAALHCPLVANTSFSLPPVAEATNYNWSVPAGWAITSGAGTNSILVTTGSTGNNGNVQVVAENGCSSSAPVSLAVTVSSAPAAPVVLPGSFQGCNQFNANWQVSLLASGYYLDVSLVPSFASFVAGYNNLYVGNVNTYVVSGLNPGTVYYYRVRAENICGTSPNSGFMAVLTSSPPVAPVALAGIAAGCNQITARWNAVAGSLAYFLDVSTVATFATYVSGYNNLNVGNVTNFIVSGLLPGNTYYYRVRASSGCGSSANSGTIAYATLPGTPAVPGSISGPAQVCQSTTGINYSVSNVAGVSYTWTVPSGWTVTAGAGTNAISVTSGIFGQNGTISVTAGNSCGTSAPQTVAVAIKPLPTVAAAPGNQTVCSGTPITSIIISNPNGVAGTTLGWSRDNTGNLTGMPANGTGGAINGTLTNSTGIMQTSLFTVYAEAATCSSFITVMVNVRPLPVAVAGPNQTVCASTGGIIGGSPAASGGTPPYGYAWTPSTGLSAANISNPLATPASYPQTYDLVVTDNFNCASLPSSVILSSGSSAKTWIGTGSGLGGPDNNFNNPSNWSPPGVPGSCNDVVMNISIVSIFSVGTNVTVSLTNDATIKSLSLNVGGISALSLGAVFKLDVGSNSLNILNAATVNSNAQSLLAVPAKTYLSVGNGGVLTYGGNLSTSASNGCTNYPFNANVNNAGKVYINSNATLAGIGNDNTTKPAEVTFDGNATQTITNNNGSGLIFLSSGITKFGEVNSPTVFFAGAGSGFRTNADLEINNTSLVNLGTVQTLNRTTAGGTFSIGAGATLILGKNSGGATGSNFPFDFTTMNFSPASTVEYNGTANQTIYGTPVYGHLTVTNGSIKRAGAPLTIMGNLTINPSATFLANGATGWTHNLYGNFVNNGAFQYTGGTTNVFNFTGTANTTISGASSTPFYSVAVSKGSNINTSLTVLSAVTTANASNLSFNSGLLKIDPTGTFTHNGSGPTITATSGLHVNGGNFTITDATLSNQGLMRITSGNVNIGTVPGNSVNHNSGGVFDMQGGTMNVAGRLTFSTGASATSTISGGLINLVTVGNSSATASLDMTAATKINVSGGIITFRRANAGPGGDINILTNPGNKVFSGGTLQLGTTLSPAAQLYKVNTQSAIYDFTVHATNGPTAQLLSNIPGSNNITIGGTLDAFTNNRDVFLFGNWVNNGNFLSGTATVTFNGNGSSVISGSSVSSFYNLTNANTTGGPLTVDMHSTVSKKLSLQNGARLHLGTGNITLRSTALETAEVDKIYTNNAITYASGRFTVERYIHTGTALGQHSKAWQLLAIPTHGTQTVKEAWQEGALLPNANPVPGYGTQITGSAANATTAAVGFDVYTPVGATMKIYNPGNSSWDNIPNTAAYPITSTKGFMILVRGDRSVTAYNQSAVPTILRTSGKLYTPGTDAPPAVLVGANLFESVSNPFASAIDFKSAGITKSNLADVFYVWDPQLTSIGPNSAYGLGGFQTFTPGPGGDYEVTPGGGSYGPAGSIHNFIESGQAFLVVAGAGSGSIGFNEQCKISGSNLVSRATRAQDMQLRTNLYVDYNGAPVLVDGVLSRFEKKWSNLVDLQDAPKAGNVGEALSILTGGRNLAVEKRKPVAGGDTIFFHIRSVKLQHYEFEFLPNAFHDPHLEAYLEDTHLGTLTPVSLTSATRISFMVENLPSSYAAERFRLIFVNRHHDLVKQDGETGVFLVYPNPSDGTVNIQLPEDNAQYIISLLSSEGRNLMMPAEYQKSEKNIQLNFPGFIANGNYWLVFRREDGRTFKRSLVIKR